MFQQPDAKKV